MNWGYSFSTRFGLVAAYSLLGGLHPKLSSHLSEASKMTQST